MVSLFKIGNKYLVFNGFSVNDLVFLFVWLAAYSVFISLAFVAWVRLWGTWAYVFLDTACIALLFFCYYLFHSFEWMQAKKWEFIQKLNKEHKQNFENQND